MRLEKARPLIVVDNMDRCGHCLSMRVEEAEFEVLGTYDPVGVKGLFERGYFCLDCEQISLPCEETPVNPSEGSSTSKTL
ncbi:MAG: hypothetical protein ACE5H5_06555 [Nitrospinota bacterium]